MTFDERIWEFMEQTDWSISITANNGMFEVDMENYSPLGALVYESFCFDGTAEDFANEWISIANDFDTGEYAEKNVRGVRGLGYSVEELLSDAEEVARMYRNLADDLNIAFNS